MFRVVRMDHTRHRHPKAVGGLPWGGAWGRGRAMDALIGVALVGCIAAVSFGLALIPRRLSVALAATRSNPAAEAAVIAQALAEVRR